MGTEESRKASFEIKCLRPIVVVTIRDSVRNDEILRRAEIDEILAKKVDRRVLRWFGHIERIWTRDAGKEMSKQLL